MSQTKAQLVEGLNINTSAPADSLVVDSSGKVGIGTTSPRFALSLGSTSSTDTATPTTLDLGGSYSNTAGANAKLRLYWDGTNTFGFGVSANQLDYISGSGTSHVFHVGASERFRCDSSGRLLVGTSSSLAPFNTPFQVASGGAQVLVNRASNISAGSVIYMSHSRNNTVGGNTILLADDEIGAIQFYGADGTSYTHGASITALVDGTPGANDMPGRLVFSTTADGASSPTERFRINNQGVAIFYYGVYAPALYTTTVTGRDVYVDNNGQLGYLSSTLASKTNIQDIDQVDWLYTLEAKSFNYRKKDESGEYTDEYEEELQYGLVAEEVEPMAPELCFYDEKEDGSKTLAGISYQKLIAPLVKAVQDLKAENKALQDRVTALESE